MSTETADEKFMRQCFALALKAEGRTAPNPIVGAVVVKDGEVVGSGFHAKAGQPHAEVLALDQAGERAQGATIYVSLEPCCHHGRTPPCTDKVITSGVKKVVAAMTDPNPKVSGQGFQKLREAGIEVLAPVLECEAEWHNRAFIKTIREGLPWLTLKLATTLDGKIADRNGISKWITGPEARLLVHNLRNRIDCVLVGANTARLDNPELNVRELREFRHPLRALIDTNLTVSPQSRACDPDTGGDTIIYCSEKPNNREISMPPSVSIVEVPFDSADSEKLDLRQVLRDLKERGVSSVLCEGGGVLAGSLIEADLADELYWIVAPAVLGDRQAVSSVAIARQIDLKDIKRFHLLGSRMLGNDTVIHMTRERFEFASSKSTI